MIKYLIAILDKQATSFCYYENPDYYRPASVLMPREELEKTVDYAARNKIAVNFLYGNRRLPGPYEDLIESIDHVKIMPLKLRREMSDGIFVINRDDRQEIDRLEENFHLNLILRLEREDLGELAGIFRSLLGKFRRLNLCLLNMADYRPADLTEYGNQLAKIEHYAADEYRAGNMPEINFISDRFMLQNMNNCDAGITHLTAAPNGKLYLCPGFYYDNAENSPATRQPEIEIKNSRLLKLSHAPICRNCDAYQCKRCLFLNQKITGEINTPSSQQCIASHLERNTSGRLLDALKPVIESFRRYVSIPAIPYLDPYEIVNNIAAREVDHRERERLIAGLLSKPLENMTTKELLFQVYRLDKELLIQLKNIVREE